MSQWTDRVRNHAVWAMLDSVGPAIDQALQRQSIEADAIDSLERLRTVLSFCGKRLAATESVLVIPSVLDTLNTSFIYIKESVEKFASNGDMSQLIGANAHADNALGSLVSILGTATPDDLTAISEAASAYRNTLEKHLRDALAIQQELAAKSKANGDTIAALEIAVAAEQQKLSALITDYQSQFSTSQDKRASDFATTQADFLAKHTAATTEQQTLFSTDQDSRRTAFSEFQAESQKTLTAMMSEYTLRLKDHDASFLKKEESTEKKHEEELESLHASYEVKANGILSKMEEQKQKVEKLVGVIGNLGVTSGYQKVANRAQAMLYTWQILTVLALGFLMLIAVTMAFPKLADKVSDKVFGTSENVVAQVGIAAPPVNVPPARGAKAPEPQSVASVSQTPITDSDFYHGLAVRVFLAMTCIVFAAYSARQARHFLSIENKNRKRALELEAVGPYIAPLSKEAQDEFLVELGKKSFGVSDLESPALGDDPVSIADTLKPKVLGEYLHEVWKGFKGK